MPKIPRHWFRADYDKRLLGPDSPLLKLPRAKPRDLEHQEQSLLFQWAELATGRVPELKLLFAIPNFAGRLGKATARHGARLKAEGRKKGVPDVFLPVARGPYHGIFLELKAGDGKPSAEQKAWLTALREEGYRAEVAVGWEAAAAAIEQYLALTAPLTAATRTA